MKFTPSMFSPTKRVMIRPRIFIQVPVGMDWVTVDSDGEVYCWGPGPKPTLSNKKNWLCQQRKSQDQILYFLGTLEGEGILPTIKEI